jgi:hypothetical protein
MLRARLAALLSLCAVTAGFTYGGWGLYEYVRDALVAPAILSPHSDVVVANKLKLGELEVERVRALAEIEGIDADLAGAEQAIARLEDLQRTVTEALSWTSTITSQKAEQGAAELTTLAHQESVIVDMLEEQKRLTVNAERDVEAGLISKGDYARQQQSLGQMELALLDNHRSTQRSRGALRETSLVQQALARRGGVPAMPELIARQEQIIRVELEIVRLDSEKRTRSAQRKALVERLTKVDEMAAQIKNRPMFQAVEKNLDVAFVPYTQIDGVSPGAGVFSCTWGLFFCRPVGTVIELLPGEVVQADPWGTPNRGQYAVLDLQDHESARAKTLRVRSWTGRARAPVKADTKVSSR